MKNLDDIKKIAKKCLKCKKPLCVKACPLSNPIPDILKAIEEDNLDLAKTLLFNNGNAGIVCSYLCDFKNRCLGNCVLNKKGDAVPFYEVERYFAESLIDYKDKHSDTLDKVAIIGAGISGISCAIDLKVKGYNVTIFEKNSMIGGVISSSLPTFRYDSKRINLYLEVLKKLDIHIEFNKEFGKNLLIKDLKDYKIIILAMGTPISNSIIRPSEYVKDAMSLLELARKDKLDIKNKKCMVIGGGNIAIDIARVLKKLDNDVTIAYRRNKLNSPASVKEIEDSLYDGVKWLECVSPVDYEIINNEVEFKLEKMKLVEDPSSSRMKFVSTGEFKTLTCDLVVEAVGVKADYSYLNKLERDVFEKLTNYNDGIDHVIYKGQIIFATGDYLIGASTFAEATNAAKLTVERIEKEVWK